MPPVIGVGEPIATVDGIKLAVGPTEGVANPSGGSAHFLLDEPFEAISISLSLCDLIFPTAVEGIAKAGAFPVTDESVHGLVVAFNAHLDLPKRLGPSRGVLRAQLGCYFVGGGHPQISG